MGCTERFSFVDIRSWDERKVGEWLRSIDFAKYENDFEENNITGEALLECDHSVLKELGVKKVGDRVRIVVAIKALRTRAYGNGKKRNRVCFNRASLKMHSGTYVAFFFSVL